MAKLRDHQMVSQVLHADFPPKLAIHDGVQAVFEGSGEGLLSTIVNAG